MSENQPKAKQKFPIWIPIVSIIVAVVLNAGPLQYGFYELAMVDIFGSFLANCFILYLINGIVNLFRK
ncbi:hypothetical protein MOMA_05826 [Moraxella macacae 0408225]|uniref:Uncharacterized protein n=1 Tax=Moraxella macacae 0408225 TaxID=1230338 RepID=L2F5A6_9GAMM|nr:hypothetical protein [Moraxella macacae]ELA08055.1 hypothetical protein MOMA_05826 [Moraxella macacae 0408225]